VVTITVYRFDVYDIQSDEVIPSKRWGTREAIIDIARGRVREETATEVDDSVIRSDIHGFTVRDFDPYNRRTGFQTEVKS
jgi:hypothetical protein